MEISDQYLRASAFLCVESSPGVEPQSCATGFFVEDRTLDHPRPVWVVTARHCIQEGRAAGKRLFLRVNTRDSYVDVPTEPDDWFESDRDDVAVTLWQPDDAAVFQAVPMDCFVSSNYSFSGSIDFPIDETAVCVGHDVFFVGLFSQHPGKARNLPIARFGAISRTPGESISIGRDKGVAEELVAYLVEARSWGGHSGSPVFWCFSIPMTLYVNGPPDPEIPARRIPTFRECSVVALLGLVSGHFDIPQDAVTQGDIMGRVTTPVNAGIAVVTPAHAIRELLERDDVARAGNQHH